MADLIVLKFDDTYGAQQALSAIRALEELRYAWVDDVAVVERHNSGRMATHTTHGSVTEGAAWGGLTGLLVGLLFPPFGFLGMWLAGMGVGAAIGKATKETGLDKQMLKDIKDELDKGTSALIMIGATGDIDEMSRAFEPYNPTKAIRHPLSDETVDTLKSQLEESERQLQAEEEAAEESAGEDDTAQS